MFRAYLAGTVIDHLDSPRRRAALHTAPSIPGIFAVIDTDHGEFRVELVGGVLATF
jgi:hypothetical protein